MIKGIPPAQIVKTAARRNKDYELEFINTDSNSDLYTLSVFLRKNTHEKNALYKVRMMLTSSILAAPALHMIWKFSDEEYELASRVFHRVCDEVDDVKSEFDRSMAPAPIIASLIKEACKPISVSRQEKTNILAIDELHQIHGVSDWRKSLYSNRYPNMSQEEKKKIQNFEGNNPEGEYIKINYGLREKY